MINSKKVLGITLARGGSKSVKKKNIIPVSGKPLLAYTIEEALKSKYLDRYIVSTEDGEIARVAKDFGADVPFPRPIELAQDVTTSADALFHAVTQAEKVYKEKYNYVIEIMCTNPLKTVNDIDACIAKLDATGADSVVSVVQIFDHHPLRVKKIENDEILDFCVPEVQESRRQDLKPDAYVRNGSIYALKRETIMAYKSRRGKISRPYIMPGERSINIDKPADVYYAEFYLKARGND